MRQARDLRGGHRPRLPIRNPADCPGAQAHRRAVAQLATGAPVVPVLVIAVIALLDLADGPGTNWTPLLAAGPALATTTNGPRGVLCIGLLAGVLGALLGIQDGVHGRELAAVLSALLAVTLAGALASALRGRRERVLAAVRSVAEAAQHALLKPVPERIGPFRVAVRYSAAAAEARIGGDLYALVPTPYGIRLIVGDVRGKGLAAVETAALVLGVFREAAYDEPDLLAVVGRIERSLARNLGRDDFVTAVVAGYPWLGRLEVVNCGHAPPLLVRGSGTVVAVEPADPAPPLGLSVLSGGAPSLQVLPFDDGDQLLLYTDGVTEARNHDREFYPLAEGLRRHLSDDPGRTLTALHDDLLMHVGGRLHDDAALLLLQKPAEPAFPAQAATEPESDAGRPAASLSVVEGGAWRSDRAEHPCFPRAAFTPMEPSIGPSVGPCTLMPRRDPPIA
ncbi:PP2C family protein-serine/threonine phosphatase [Streptomyces sp. NPDC002758]